MEQYIMKGGNPLVGDVTISGAKNAALGILAASIMTDEDVVIENLPDVSDINALLDAIRHLGAKVERPDRHTVRINARDIHAVTVEDEHMRRSAHPITSLAHFLESIRARRFRFPAVAPSEADPLTSI